MPTSATLFFRRYLSSNSFFRLPKVPTTMSMGTLISVVSFELISYTVNYTLAPQQLGEQYFPLWRPAPSPPLDHRQTSPGHWSKFKGSCQTKFTLQGWLFWNRVKQGFPEAVNWKHCNFKVGYFKTRQCNQTKAFVTASHLICQLSARGYHDSIRCIYCYFSFTPFLRYLPDLLFFCFQS